MTGNAVQMTNPAFDDFLNAAGWAGAAVTPLAGDASSRSYFRVADGARGAVLMSAPPAAETPSCPPAATPAERCRLGYNASARLAGPNLNAFVAIAETLRAAGLSAPEVFAADAEAGLALIEDLGDGLFAAVVEPGNENALYENAIDALLRLHAAAPPPPRGAGYEMLAYDHLALMTEAELLIDWYWRLKKGAPPEDSVKEEFRDVFDAMLAGLDAPNTIVLRDYHAENLLWLPDRKGPARVGVIDFQDGLVGSPAYDLVSLLEDARRDVDEDLTQAMIDRYTDARRGREEFDRDRFLNDYAVLAVQRNAKILGVFARLAERDGKPRYLDFLPRVEAHFRRDLARPPAAGPRAFFKTHFPELTA